MATIRLCCMAPSPCWAGRADWGCPIVRCTWRVTKRAPKTMNGKQGANHTKLKIKGLRTARYRLTATPAGGRARHATFRIKRR